MHACMSVYVTNNFFEFLRFLIPLSCYNPVLITYVLKTYVPTKPCDLYHHAASLSEHGYIVAIPFITRISQKLTVTENSHNRKMTNEAIETLQCFDNGAFPSITLILYQHKHTHIKVIDSILAIVP